MGKPTLIEPATYGIARGDELYLNDGAILAETQGNLERRVNIVRFANVWCLHVDFRAAWTITGQATDQGTSYGPEFVMPSAAKFMAYNWIAFDDHAAQETTFDRNGAHALSPSVTNTISVYLGVKPGNESMTPYALASVDESNKDFSGVPPADTWIPAGALIHVKSTIHADAWEHSSNVYDRFDPWIQGNFWFREEHLNG